MPYSVHREVFNIAGTAVRGLARQWNGSPRFLPSLPYRLPFLSFLPWLVASRRLDRFVVVGNESDSCFQENPFV